MGRLQDKIAVVTGAASGIGRATSLRFAREGAIVMMVDVNQSPLAAVAEEARGQGLLVDHAVVDVADDAAVDELVDRVVLQHGRIDVMFANAGIGGGGKDVLSLTDADWLRVLDVNLMGVVHCGKSAARAMLAQGTKGRIVFTASTYAEVTAHKTAAYSASKGAVRMFTKSMALELGRHGITVNAVAPGFIRTGMNPLTDTEQLGRILPRIPLGRVGTPDDVAGTVLFLASDDAAYVTGAMLLVDGGWVIE